MSEKHDAIDIASSAADEEVGDQEGLIFLLAQVELFSDLSEGKDNVIIKNMSYHSTKPLMGYNHVIECKWKITGLPVRKPWPGNVTSKPIILGNCDKKWCFELVISKEEHHTISCGCIGRMRGECGKKLEVLLQRTDDVTDKVRVISKSKIINEKGEEGINETCSRLSKPGNISHSIFPQKKCVIFHVDVDSKQSGFCTRSGEFTIESELTIEKCCDDSV